MNEQPVRVLVVDDEPQIRRFLRTSLTTRGYHIEEASSGEEALAKTAEQKPDLILLDLGLPALDGLDVISRLREWSDTPIIVLSVRDRELDKIKALDNGADDYLTKPFGIGELMARLRAALRHRNQQEIKEPLFVCEGLKVDLLHRLVSVDGRQVKLTPKEYELLRVLVIHAGKVLTHRQLLTQVWGASYSEQTHYLRIYINQLRQKLEPEPTQPHYILTELGVGYRLYCSCE